MAIFKDGGTDHSDRSQYDRKRHRQLMENAIKRNLGDIIAEESIIGQSKDKKIKIPVKGIKEYQFVYGKNSGGTASGSGQEQKGQVVGKVNDQQQPGAGQPGTEPGEEIYETEITMEEIVHYLFDELKLPDMDRKKYGLIETQSEYKRLGYQRKGIPPRLAKKRTVVEKLKREQGIRRSQAEAGLPVPERVPFREDDLRYHRVREEVQHRANAVIFCIMDTSGSMDQTKKYLARSFYFLLYQFVRWKYQHVEVVFIAHTTEAKEVTEWEFFHRGEAGGTVISSGYAKALEIIEQRYAPEIWNIYAFHCSDGDNWGDDNTKAIALARQLCEICVLFGYGEIAFSHGWNVTIRRDFERDLKADNFVIALMNKQEDIWPAFKKILDKQSDAGGDDS
ncbi:YeaH/YhbH family protein|uniref:UPF0229 protein SAMN04488502_11016 n=1 Tax=Dendrosporobacter quercicolus TaxID=146817 RepID=A0A1G9XQU5_9FIRM|nr:YeaH/YhbH family protein [Dendrosporobacter quercicolus]NSL49113.1 YeaH/YhbH family protein [Dendrosporobacter quercicolus DSM 1736]SDM99090.1 hypothetical protein SAMN04488502_11016 [Dendrosporobacter quercicolus]